MRKPDPLYVGALLLLLAGEITEAQVPFLPYGSGDTLNPIVDDGSSGAIALQHPFKYFGRTYNQIYVNNNGLLTFDSPNVLFTPNMNIRKDMIAPFWVDLDNRRGGTISYREHTSGDTLGEVTESVRQLFPNIPFRATSVFVATWNNVPYYEQTSAASFQVILAYNPHHSFVIFLYVNIPGTSHSWRAGYSTLDSVGNSLLPVTDKTALPSSSNIGVDGVWVFEVERSPDLPTTFLPFGNYEMVTPFEDDGSSDAISLQQPFEYFGQTYNQIFVNNNGHLTFTGPLANSIPALNTGGDIIAPLWTNLDNRRGGTISYREDTSSALLDEFTAVVREQFPSIPFKATSTFIVTWDNVPYFSGEGVVSFQVVLVYNAHRSFVLMYYGDAPDTIQPWQAGYNSVNSGSSFTIEASSVPELSSSSNIGVTAFWVFQVDGSPNLPANFLPFGNGEIVNPFSHVGSSDAIDLPQTFTYFGREYNKIFVNNNGHLTFMEPLSSYSPSMNSGKDIIAPLWTHLDNRRGGTISYRVETNRVVLDQVTAAINQYFPNLPLPFTAESGFVATWDIVPYYSGQGVATFQVVLVTSVDHSFALFSYGNIAETSQVWKVLYDTVDSEHSSSVNLLTASQLSSRSNIEDNGRWGFQVNNVCDTLGCTVNEVCSYRQSYGCACLEGQRSNPESIDATQTCASSTGTMSLSRCQLYEMDVPPGFLHLNDPSCRGTAENGRVVFHFDNENHICGTSLLSNNTHFIYQNSIHSNLPTGVITRDDWINIAFSCVYPLIQTLSMPMGIEAIQSVVSVDRPGQGTYQINMIPYHDAQFTSPFQGSVEVQVNQQMYVAVQVEGVDESQFATVLDNCWATPVNDLEHEIRWNLIVGECPNPDDGTVEVLQNGNGVTSRFSFRMFTFTGASDRIFLHCQVHLCLLQNGRCAQSCEPGQRRRRRRFLDFHHSAAITMGF